MYLAFFMLSYILKMYNFIIKYSAVPKPKKQTICQKHIAAALPTWNLNIH